MKTKKRRIFSLGAAVVVLACAFALSPFVIMILGSFKPNMALSVVPVDFSPLRNVTLKNYIEVTQTVNVFQAYLNSLRLMFFVVGSEVLLSVMAGYIFAVKEFRMKRVLFAMVIVTMMMPRQLLLVPNFMVAKKLKLIDSIGGAALTTINASYGIFLARQYMLSISRDFYESARIDGCGELGIFSRIVLPLSKPVMAAVAISSMFTVWNDYLWQNIMLTSGKNQTVPLMLAYLSNKSKSGIPSFGIQLSGSVISVIPLLIFFMIFQKWFIEGVSAGGVKE